MENYCLINPGGGELAVNVISSNAIRTVGYFYLAKLIDNEYEFIDSETNQISTGNVGEYSFNLEHSVDKVAGKVLFWDLRSCAMFSQGERGKVKIEIWQDGIKCKTTKSTLYSRKHPNCDGTDGEIRVLRNKLVFAAKPEIRQAKLLAKINSMIVLIILMLSNISYSQTYEAFNYKLDYEVPESPALSILDGNPSTVTRATSAQELVVNLANNLINGNSSSSGVAVDFNPFFVFGGRLKSINDYRGKENYFNRLLANTQLSFATVPSQDFPNDVLMSTGVRITLWDDRDLLNNDDLGKKIDAIIMPDRVDSPEDLSKPSKSRSEELKDVYKELKEELKNKNGWACSLGFGTSARVINNDFKLNNFKGFRNQVWLSGEYSFRRMNIMALTMYRNTVIEQKDNISELNLGLGFRYLTSFVNIGGEVVHSSEKDRLDIGTNFEFLVMNRLIVYLSVGNRSNIVVDDNKIRVIPGLKWNISESKK